MTKPLFELDERWDAWLADRSPEVRELAERFPPNYLYENTEVPGQLWTVVSYSEDGTLRMYVDGQYNPFVMFSREVFGVKPEHVKAVEPPAKP